MVTVIVEFAIPESEGLEHVRTFYRQIAPEFRFPKGLIRKYFLRSSEGRRGGGVYLWKSRDLAEQFYDSGFREAIAQRFGTQPRISFFDTPVIVDNLTSEILHA